MKRPIRKIVLSAAVLTPGLAYIGVHVFSVSSATVLIGLIGVWAAVFTLMTMIKTSRRRADQAPAGRSSLLTNAALVSLRNQNLNPMHLRCHLNQLITRAHGAEGFVTLDDQVAMVLAQVMARWGITDPMQLDDDQARELWLVEQLMRATPAKAGALSENFTTPDAMLAMRDRIADSVIA